MPYRADLAPSPALCAVEALYIHVPFCRSICPFCAFAVHGNRPQLHEPYLRALRQEIAQGAEQHAAQHSPRLPVRSVYFGGGTPSTLAIADLAALLEHLERHFPFSSAVEITLEVNPEDATEDTLRGLVALGVTRVSLGMQSLDGSTLKALGRNHDAAGSRAALDAVQRWGPPNHNVDVMFGAPEQPPAAFRTDVAELVRREVPHLSLYGLDVEPGTLFHRRATVRDWCEAHREAQAGQYRWAAETLSSQGWRHYEVSNFCRSGQEARQNLIVWDGGNYLGFGPGAHSHLNGVRLHNARHLRDYLHRMNAGVTPVVYQEELSVTQRANEALMLALRRDDGLSLTAWHETFGLAPNAHRNTVVAALLRERRAVMQGERLVLTISGRLVADEITTALALDD